MEAGKFWLAGSGLPYVILVGTSDATRRIRTGDRVRVNGSLGRVEILA